MTLPARLIAQWTWLQHWAGWLAGPLRMYYECSVQLIASFVPHHHHTVCPHMVTDQSWPYQHHHVPHVPRDPSHYLISPIHHHIHIYASRANKRKLDFPCSKVIKNILHGRLLQTLATVRHSNTHWKFLHSFYILFSLYKPSAFKDTG